MKVEEAVARKILADRIERAGKIEAGEIEFNRADAGYASILKAFYPQERAVIIAALRSQ